MRFLELPGNSPFLNLALEETLLSELLPQDEGIFLLWQNKPSIIIGRHQSVAEVVNLEIAFNEKIPIIRRMSGGGAVYHDKGNLNFSFIVNANIKQNFGDFLRPICQALDDFGIHASISGRNDIEVDGRKISGSSQYVLGNKLLHHGTLLFNVDIKKMSLLLRSDPGKLASRGVASIEARIGNLVELAPTPIALAALKASLACRCANATAHLSRSILEKGIALTKEKYGNPAWNYGKSPHFDMERKKRFSWGEIIIRLALDGNRISNCEIRGDFFNAKPISDIENRMKGLNFTQKAMLELAKNLEMKNYFLGCDPQKMREFFTKTLFS